VLERFGEAILTKANVPKKTERLGTASLKSYRLIALIYDLIYLFKFAT
jgi:hypothetical protein